jgi:hypothetical protein
VVEQQEEQQELVAQEIQLMSQVIQVLASLASQEAS